MRRATLLSRVLSLAPLRSRTHAIDASARHLGARGRDELRFALGAAQFGAGDYEAARGHYDAVGPGALRDEADRMVDWIDYKFGRLGGGWPRYPVARFVPPAEARIAPGNSPIQVKNFNRPVELVDGLGLRAWRPRGAACGPSDGPVLVWFNFHDSLGGEVLAAKVVRAFQRQTGADLILAVDPRLETAMRQNFSGTPVISKASDLRPLERRCAGYFLARDALAHVVRTEADCTKVAAESFILDPVPPLAPTRTRPVLAVTWKTTNRRQRAFRNLPLAQLAMLLAGIDADFVSAQHGTIAAERKLLARRLGDRIRFDAIDTSADLATLAAALARCDAVLTIDNSVLHIAGAFGVPTLALLAVPSYWAWPASGPSSRWYRSVRLVHQPLPGDWRSVMAQARTIVSGWSGGDFR